MDFLFPWVSNGPDLARWEQRPFSAGVEQGPAENDNRDNHERIIGREAIGPPEVAGIARRTADAILRFDVFPPSLLAKVVRHTPVQIGDTVGLCYHFVPGIDLFFAARVIDRFEGTEAGLWRCGFTYRTLAGHPECGEETFVVEKSLAKGTVTAALRSWSRPGLWVSKLTYPIIRRLQLRAGSAALDHLQKAERRDQEGAPAAEPLAFGITLPRRNLRTGLLRSDGRW